MAKILMLKDGTEKEVQKDNGRYWICKDGTQFKKQNPQIESVKTVKAKKETIKAVEAEAENEQSEVV